MKKSVMVTGWMIQENPFIKFVIVDSVRWKFLKRFKGSDGKWSWYCFFFWPEVGIYLQVKMVYLTQTQCLWLFTGFYKGNWKMRTIWQRILPVGLFALRLELGGKNEKTDKYFLSAEKVEKSTNIFGKEIFIRPPAWWGAGRYWERQFFLADFN